MTGVSDSGNHARGSLWLVFGRGWSAHPSSLAAGPEEHDSFILWKPSVPASVRLTADTHGVSTICRPRLGPGEAETNKTQTSPPSVEGVLLPLGVLCTQEPPLTRARAWNSRLGDEASILQAPGSP